MSVIFAAAMFVLAAASARAKKKLLDVLSLTAYKAAAFTVAATILLLLIAFFDYASTDLGLPRIFSVRSWGAFFWPFMIIVVLAALAGVHLLFRRYGNRMFDGSTHQAAYYACTWALSINVALVLLFLVSSGFHEPLDGCCNRIGFATAAYGLLKPYLGLIFGTLFLTVSRLPKSP